MKIIPSILTNNLSEAIVMLKKAEGVVERVQIDIVDGQFNQNKTILPDLFRNIETPLLLDFHLMVKEPINWVESTIRAGADRIIGQIEMMGSQIEFISKIQGLGSRTGLAVDINTPIKQIDSSILTDLDVVLVMNYPAGVGGQRFDKRVLEKIKFLTQVKSKDTTPFQIISDGGVNNEIINLLKDSGVDEVVIGKYLFEGDLNLNIQKLTKLVQDV